tara:strand:+ start:581 stop:1834 length:1254 start_codon:yes stop_codon:yes gene_type:complete
MQMVKESKASENKNNYVYNVNYQALREKYDFIEKKWKDYMLVKYKKDNLNKDNINEYGMMRSVIFKNDKMVCFSPPKSLNYNNFIVDNEFKNCVATMFMDGTMINVFYDKDIDEWIPCTKSFVGAKCKFNLDSKKTFYDMFMEAMRKENITYDSLNKNYCYSFVLQHPDNKVVQNSREIMLYLTNVYKIDGENSRVYDVTNIVDTSNFRKPDKFKYKLFESLFGVTSENDEEIFEEKDIWIDFTELFTTDTLRHDIPGYVVYNANGERAKIRNINYENVKFLRGNSQKLQHRYLTLRNQNKLHDYLKHYTGDKDIFQEYQEELYDWTEKLYNEYVTCFIYKKCKLSECAYELKPILYKLHKDYIEKLKPSNKNVNFAYVKEFIKTLPVKQLMFSINYHKREDKVTTNGETTNEQKTN